jgi:hypothetical protein
MVLIFESLVAWVQRFVFETSGVDVPLCRGRSVFLKNPSTGLMPTRMPIDVVVGAPIDPLPLAKKQKEQGNFRPLYKETREAENGDPKLVDELYQKYVAVVEALYHKHKDAAWNRSRLHRMTPLKLA